MGLFNLIGGLAAGAASKAIKKSIDKYNTGSSSSSSGRSSGSRGITSSTTNSLRDYLGQYGKNPTVDDTNRTVSFGGNTYDFGNIPGTTFDRSSGMHYVTNPDSFYKETGIGAPTQQLPGQIMATTGSQHDPTDYIRQLQEAQRQSRIAALDKARNAALGSLDTEQASVEPMYYDKRNQAAAASDVGAMNFAQYMAARGIKGAAGAMPEIYRQAGLQGQIGALDRQEAANLAAIERQRSYVESGYASDVAAANADVESQAMQAMIDQWNQNRQYELQRGALTGSLGDERTLAGQQFDYSKSSSNPEVQGQILNNQARELELAAQEIQNSFLPETLKLQAERLAQQVKTGALDYDTALAQLNQIKAQTKALNAPPVVESPQPSKTEVENYWISSALSAMNNLSPIQRAQWLKENQSEIIQNAGTGAYDYLFKQINANEADTALVNLYNEMNSLPTKEAKNSWLWENRDYILGTYGQGVYDQLMKEIYG
jgi:hypothetical protein